MAKLSLTPDQVKKIKTLITSWEGKLTWDLLVQTIESKFDIRTTRQTLHSYISIKEEYSRKKQYLRGIPDQSFVKFVLSDIQAAERIKQLQSENDVLQRQVDKQLAFIQLIADTAKSNPSLLYILNEVKRKLS
ncbi:hypothetical protein [Marinomonas sp. PE14-40]|uniref:hypothetical protein n=1 Tax=Marinomonas sp. PE14-40 TaxID=3060621 RepID=UPI003F66ED7D